MKSKNGEHMHKCGFIPADVPRDATDPDPSTGCGYIWSHPDSLTAGHLLQSILCGSMKMAMRPKFRRDVLALAVTGALGACAVAPAKDLPLSQFRVENYALTEQQAAIDGLHTILAYKSPYEFCGAVIRAKDERGRTFYFWTEPVTINKRNACDMQMEKPRAGEVVAIYHTHLNTLQFSTLDVDTLHTLNVSGYIAHTPTGRIIVWRPYKHSMRVDVNGYIHDFDKVIP